MSDDAAGRYLLPDEQNRRIFSEAIVPQQMATQVPQAQPTVVFLIGQPGAGKSRVGQLLATTLNERGGFVDVDSDLYKPYHPEYRNLLAQDDKLMAAYTRADGRRWMAQAHEHVRDHRLNAVIQETAQNPQAVAQTMRAYREAGFRVEALAMGVSEAMSNQGIINRYHEQVKERGAGRLTVQANADESYRGIVGLAKLVDDQRLVDQASVFRRGEGQARYRNELDEHGGWREPPGFAGAIEAERARTWSKSETQDFMRTQRKLRAELGPDWTARLDRIDRLAAPLMSQRAPVPPTAEELARRNLSGPHRSAPSGPLPPGPGPRSLGFER